MSSPTPTQSPFTVEWLTEALSSKVLKASQKWPRKEEIVRLVQVLNNISAAYHLDHSRILRSKTFIDFKHELEIYARKSSKQVDVQPIEDPLAAASRRFVDAANELTNLISAYDSQGIADGEFVPTKRKTWHDIAGSIATHFVWSPAGHGFGLNKTGAVSRFVCVVIPQITGDNPSLDAVGQHLSRLAAAAKKTNGDKSWTDVPGTDA